MKSNAMAKPRPKRSPASQPPLPARITVAEIARRLQMRQSVVRELLEQGIIPGRRIHGRWLIARWSYVEWEKTMGTAEAPGHRGTSAVQ